MPDLTSSAGLLRAISVRISRDPDYDPSTLLHQALVRADTPDAVIRLAEAAFDLAEPDSVQAACEKLAGFGGTQKQRIALETRTKAMWDITDLPAPSSAATSPAPIPGRIAYVLYSSLPYLSTGYALRSHALAKALHHAGTDVQCITRPGFPWDERAETLLCPAPQTEPDAQIEPEIIEGLPYHRLRTPLFDSWSGYPAYVHAATETLVARLRVLRPTVVMAASSHACALPALRAARQLGLPFIHDMRGMWELSRAARERTFLNSPQFRYERSLETFVARQSDHVFTLSLAMHDAMILRGVAPQQITFLPNGCDPARFGPAGRSANLRARLQIPKDLPVIGYAGSFPTYEGLEDLISAAARLKHRGHRFRLVMVGDENGTGAHDVARKHGLMQQAAALGVADRLLLTGRISPDQVADFMDLFDIVTVPRRSLPVTEMVAPLKPVEAMAAGKPLVVSSVGGMAGLVRPGQTGLSFPAGDVTALVTQLEQLLTRPDLRAQLAIAARAEAQTRFSWDEIATKMLEKLPQVRS